MNKIIYLDAAATYQKPQSVIDAEIDFLQTRYANAGRGVCARAVAVDDMVLLARKRVAQFMGADAGNIVFTSGTTAAMNMIAKMLGLGPNSVVAVSDLDHHSARLPFVMSGAEIVLCPLDADFNYVLDDLPFADVMVLTAMSNVIGVAQKIPEIVRIARNKNPNVIIVVDCAQYVVHEKIDATMWGADFICWSGHKIGADTGIGVLYIRDIDRFAPVNFGGGMVAHVAGNQIDVMQGAEKFEAGTLPLTQIAGIGSAIDSLEQNRPSHELVEYVYDALIKMPRVRVLSSRKAAMVTFAVEGMHPLDMGMLIGARGVCVRAGNMCASWIHERIGVVGSVRISIGAYNTMADVKYVVKVIEDILG